MRRSFRKVSGFFLPLEPVNHCKAERSCFGTEFRRDSRMALYLYFGSLQLFDSLNPQATNSCPQILLPALLGFFSK